MDFHHFLDAHETPFEQMCEDLLERYAYDLTHQISPATLRRFTPSTIRRRWSTLTRAIWFCQNRGYLKNRFPFREVRTPRGSSVVLDIGVKLPGLNEPDELVTALHHETLNGVFDELGPNPRSVDAGGLAFDRPTTAVRLMVELCWNTGMRRSEVCSLSVQHFLHLSTRGKDPLSSIAISIIGKGSKKRKVPVFVWLIAAVQSYIENERDQLIRMRIESGRGNDHGYAFVLRTNSTVHRGAPITPQVLDRKFAAAREKFIEKTRTLNVEAFSRASRERITIHSLRHTFALHTYVAQSRSGHGDPIKYIQSVLGHSMRETTEAIYLRSAQVYRSEIEDELRRHIEEALSPS